MNVRLRSATFLCALFLCCGCGGGGDGGGGGGNGTIYYNDVEDGFIYKMALADATITKLIFGSYPNRTAEGTFVYVNGTDLAESADGVQVRTIITSNVNDTARFNNSFAFPSLSPDGQKIAYNTLEGLVYVCRRDNGQILSTFTETPPGGGLTGWERPTWTPDGRIVVAGNLGTPGIYISDAGWTTLTRFDPMLNQPDHAQPSPKGGVVAFEANSHIWTINLDGTGLKQLTNGNNQEKFPTWNPDGSSIAAFQLLDLITMNADGSNQKTESMGNPNVFFNFNTDQAFQWTN